MLRTMGRVRLLGAVVVIGLVAAACSTAGASTGGGGQPTLSIAAPADGATVPGTFTVKLDASVPIGDPSTGEHHVHLCFDGGSCDDVAGSVIAYANTAQVTGLSPGTHTIEASLRNADHSDAGVSTTITVTVSGGNAGAGGGATTGATGSGGGSGGGRGYGY
jgi:hypothetical protein